MMLDIINDANAATTGSMVVLGGWGRYLNGYHQTYDKKIADLVITPVHRHNIRQLGMPIDFANGHSWGSNTEEQFAVRIRQEGISYYLDVFVSSELPDFTTVSGLKVVTPQYDVYWHEQASGSLQTEHLHDKVQTLKDLYGL